MPAIDCSDGRDILVFDIDNPDTVIEGPVLANGITNANLRSMIELFILFECEYYLRGEGGAAISKDTNSLQAWSYYFTTDGRLLVCATVGLHLWVRMGSIVARLVLRG